MDEGNPFDLGGSEPEAEKKPKARAEKKKAVKKAKPRAEAKPKGYVVAHGKSLLTRRRGQLNAGDAICVDDVGNEALFRDLADKGYIEAK